MLDKGKGFSSTFRNGACKEVRNVALASSMTKAFRLTDPASMPEVSVCLRALLITRCLDRSMQGNFHEDFRFWKPERESN